MRSPCTVICWLLLASFVRITSCVGDQQFFPVFVADDPCSTKFTIIDANSTDGQEGPCMFMIQAVNATAKAYHAIVCLDPSQDALRQSLENYKQLNCTQDVSLQISEFDHPLTAELFHGLQTRLRVLIIQKWHPNLMGDSAVNLALQGSPFIELHHLEVLDVSLADYADSSLLTRNFFVGLTSLRVLQTGNLAASLIGSLDATARFPAVQCVGIHQSLSRNCACQDAEEEGNLTSWFKTLHKPGKKPLLVMKDPLTATMHPCRIEIWCYLKDPTRNKHNLVVLDSDVLRKVCPNYTSAPAMSTSEPLTLASTIGKDARAQTDHVRIVAAARGEVGQLADDGDDQESTNNQAYNSTVETVSVVVKMSSAGTIQSVTRWTSVMLSCATLLYGLFSS